MRSAPAWDPRQAASCRGTPGRQGAKSWPLHRSVDAGITFLPMQRLCCASHSAAAWSGGNRAGARAPWAEHAHACLRGAPYSGAWWWGRGGGAVQQVTSTPVKLFGAVPLRRAGCNTGVWMEDGARQDNSVSVLMHHQPPKRETASMHRQGMSHAAGGCLRLDSANPLKHLHTLQAHARGLG